MKKALKVTGIVVASLALLAIAASFVLGITPLALGLHKPVYTVSGKALAGYDPVSYFEGNPVPGSAQFPYEWQASTWWFASAGNRDAFKANPEQYLPAYGGYCTKAVSTGFAAPGDPTIWLIRDGQLYLFSSQDLKAAFIRNPESITAACDQAWQ